MHEAQWLDIDPATLAGRNSLTVAGAAPEWTHRQAKCIAPDSRFNCRPHADSHLKPGHLSRSAAGFVLQNHRFLCARCPSSPHKLYEHSHRKSRSACA